MNELKDLYSKPQKENFLMIENYIYLYHIDKYIILPSFADSVTDSQAVSFSPSTPLSRSAPIYSYSHSGPRTIQVNFNLHRDLMYEINHGLVEIPEEEPGNDYVDLFIKYIQAAVVPSYEAVSKMVNPPIVALRLGNDIFIKGVVTSGIGLTYQYPILSNGRYANVGINFSIAEVDPYDAETVIRTGSFRNVNTSLERKNVVIKKDHSSSALLSGGRNNTKSSGKKVFDAGFTGISGNFNSDFTGIVGNF